IIIAAYPSVGKTALAINIAEHCAMNLGMAVGVFSCEMSARSLIRRIICSHGRVNLPRQASLRRGDLGLYVLQRQINVAIDVQLDRDIGRSGLGGRRHLGDALDRHDGVLDDVNDIGFHDFGGRAQVGEGNVDDREINVRQLADSHSHE
ncbi:MAG: hypothetical protein EBX56_02645, partial [Betaproteobacteria bacterium]|nr:hypothetical protein [Betaproteobacteria bacterium]